MLLTAFLTAYYTFRLYFRVFEGPWCSGAARPTAWPWPDQHLSDRAHDAGHDDHMPHTSHHNHEPMLMILPLVVLAIGAIVRRATLNFTTSSLGEFLGKSPSFQPANRCLQRQRGAVRQIRLSMFAAAIRAA